MKTIIHRARQEDKNYLTQQSYNITLLDSLVHLLTDMKYLKVAGPDRP